MAQERYDSVLLGMLQNEGDMPKFLDSIFSFLYRRTDYYVHLTPEGRMGFPPGIAKKMLLSTFKRYEERAAADRARREQIQRKQEEERRRLEEEREEQRRLEEERERLHQEADISECVREEEVVTATTSADVPTDAGATMTHQESPPGESVSTDISAGDKDKDADASKGPSMECSVEMSQVGPSADRGDSKGEVMESVEEGIIPAEIPVESGSGSTEAAVEGETKSEGADAAAKSEGGEEKSGTESLDEDPELARQQKLFQAKPESYNGAVRENYCWSQSITDVDVRVKVAKHVTKARDVSVDIKRRHLRVVYKGAAAGEATGVKEVVAVDDALTWDINKEQSLWSLVPGEHIHVNLEKVEERWWDALLAAEPKISIRNIDPTRPMSDLDDGTQAKVDELMYNENQKRLGLPQTHETKVHEMLRKAWDTDGSPFKGQPFDTSKINVSEGAIG